ncbi:MAG TPA: nitrilase-related carbon-nitrogen hydrolase, partial [Candidatus Methanomethylicus sp.]|nr:nitrilase-related carbon-nitrogen hydrolase [Candidatus Methanomethylicus sp.]
MAAGKAAVWIAQMASCEEKQKNLSKARRMIGEAADGGAELVLLPEFFNFLPAKMTREAYAGQAEGTGGETLAMVAEVARKRGISIIAGSMTESDGGRIYNTCYAVTPEGIVAKYRKTHLFSYGVINEAQIFSPGTSTAMAEVAGLKVGMTTCFDLRFPELYRKATMEGAQVITNVAAFLLETGRAHWMTLLRARAIENQVYVVAA